MTHQFDHVTWFNPQLGARHYKLKRTHCNLVEKGFVSLDGGAFFFRGRRVQYRDLPKEFQKLLDPQMTHGVTSIFVLQRQVNVFQKGGLKEEVHQHIVSCLNAMIQSQQPAAA